MALMNNRGSLLLNACRLSFVLIILALTCTTFYGLVNDDYLFIRVYDLQVYGHYLPEQLLRTFAFFPSPTENIQAIAKGYSQANWFTDTSIEHRFFRPLAALTHYLDYMMGTYPVAMHVHNFIYIALVIFLLWKWFAVIGLGYGQRWLMMAIFLADTATLWGGWIAQRNGWMTLAALLGGTYWYAQFILEEKQKTYVYSILMLIMGLLCSEAGVVISVFLFFTPLLLNKSLFNRRHLFYMLPVSIICLIYLSFYRHLHFGVSHHPLYTNPMTETSAAVSSLIIKVPAFILSCLGFLPAETAYFLERMLPSNDFFLIYFGLTLVVIYLALISYRFMNNSPWKGLYFYGVACTAGAMLPLMGSMIADRSGTFIKLGISITFSACLFELFNRKHLHWFSALIEKAMPYILVFKSGFVLVSAIAWLIFLLPADKALQPIKGLKEMPSHIVYLKVHDIFFTSYMLEKIQFHISPEIKTAQRLIANNGAVTLNRVNANTIILEASKGNYLLGKFDLPMEPANFASGAVYEAGFTRLTVLNAEKGLPITIQVDFKVPVESIQFLSFDGNSYVPVTLPDQGKITI